MTIIKDIMAILVIFVSFGFPQTIGGAFIRGAWLLGTIRLIVDQNSEDTSYFVNYSSCVGLIGL